MKETILSAGTKHQLSGKPGMILQFHLFVVKRIIAMKEMFKEGVILYTADIQKFFDKEMLFDCMDTLAEAKADPKVYRN